MLIAKFVTKDEELIQVAQLSAANLVTNVSDESKEKEGFVTWVYPIEALRALHTVTPSVIVKDGDTVVGYALVLVSESVAVYPHMKGTLDYASTVSYKGRPLTDQRVYFMGQICVHGGYRGQGVVKMLYQFHRQELSAKYDILFTGISPNNPRSLKAHLKAGFKVIDRRLEEGHEWDVVIWDWAEE